MHGDVTPRAALPIAARGASLAVSETCWEATSCADSTDRRRSFRHRPRRSCRRRCPHVVQPGETLWSIAAANNLTTRTVAAYNGLSESSQVVLGSTIQVPSTVEGYAALQKAGLVVRARAAAAAPAAARGARRRRRGPRPDGRLHRPPRRHAVRPGRGRARVRQRDRRHERARPERHPGRRHRRQAADRRARPGACRAARARRDRRAAGRARARPPRASAPPTCSRRRRSTGSPPRWRPRSPGRRAASTTTWSPAPTRAASCRSCPARGTTCSRTSPRAS